MAKAKDPLDIAAEKEDARIRREEMKAADNTKTYADKGPAERAATREVLADAAKNEQAKEQARSDIRGVSAPTTTPPAETTEVKGINMGQGENANAELESKVQNPGEAPVDYGEAKVEIQGHTKVTREAGDENTGKPSPADVVQQGGGGAIDAKSKAPV